MVNLKYEIMVRPAVGRDSVYDVGSFYALGQRYSVSVERQGFEDVGDIAITLARMAVTSRAVDPDRPFIIKPLEGIVQRPKDPEPLRPRPVGRMSI